MLDGEEARRLAPTLGTAVLGAAMVRGDAWTKASVLAYSDPPSQAVALACLQSKAWTSKRPRFMREARTRGGVPLKQD